MFPSQLLVASVAAEDIRMELDSVCTWEAGWTSGL